MENSGYKLLGDLENDILYIFGLFLQLVAQWTFLSFTTDSCDEQSTFNVRRTVMLVTVGVVVRYHVHVKEVLQLPLEGLESGPVLFFLLPAVSHNIIHDLGTAWWASHPVPSWNLLDHLVVAHVWNDNSNDEIMLLISYSNSIKSIKPGGLTH